MPAPAPILVTEDDDADVIFLQHVCKVLKIPNPVIALHDGDEVVNYLQGKAPFENRAQYPPPALLLLDLKMPRMTGFDVLKWLQDHPPLKTFPIVVLTSSDQDSDRQKALALGASEYCVKPGGIQNLTQLVRKINARWLKG
jgi:CheY-like chemotaxis protein